jgi:DNA-binding XRE family transcriptional regulator
MRVAERRAELGMTRNDLAARIGTLPTTIASIEEGYLPRAKIRNQLAVALNGEPSGRARRAPSGPSPLGRPRRPSVPVGTGWFSVGLPLSILIAGGLAVGAILVAGQLSGGDGAPPVPRLVAVSSVLGPPASIHRAGVQAQKAAAAEARRAAEIRRERAAAAAAAAAARKAAAKEADRSAPTQTQPVTQPVAPSPAPSGGGGQGGSSGAGDAPSLQHGIGGGG